MASSTGVRRSSLPLIAMAVLSLLTFLSLDEVGRARFESEPRRPSPLGTDASRSVTAPAGTYDLLVELELYGTLDRLEVRGAGPVRARRSIRGVGAATFAVSVGRIHHDGGTVECRVGSSAGNGTVRALVLEPALPLPVTRDGGQRLAFALFVLALVVALRPHPRTLIVATACGLAARVVVFGLVPWVAGDARAAFYPWHELAVRELGAGHVPLWNPHTFLGLPHLANVQTELLYPPVTLLLSLGASFSTRELLLGWLHLALAGLGAHACGRRLGMGRDAATLTGLLYMLSPAVQNPEHGPVLATVAITPWLIDALLAASGPRLAALLAVAIAAGHPQHLAFALVALPFLAFGAPPLRARWRTLLVGLAIAPLLAAVLLVPFLELAAGSIRHHGLSPEHAAVGALDPATFGAALPTDLGLHRVVGVGSGRRSAARFVGLLGLPLVVMALSGLSRRKRRRTVVALALLALLGLLLALGDFGPLSPTAILGHVPLFGGQRAPGRAIFIVQLALVLLCGIGWDRLRGAARRPGRTMVPVASAALIFGTTLVIAIRAGAIGPAVVADVAGHAAIAAVVLLLPALPRARFRHAALPAILVLGLMARADDSWSMRPGDWPSAYTATPQATVPPRLGTREVVLPPVYPNDTILTGRLSAWGYDPIIPYRTALLWNTAQSGLFQFDEAGRLMTLSPELSGERLLAGAGVQALRAMGVSRLRVPGAVATSEIEGLRLVRQRRGGSEYEIEDGARARLVDSARAAPSLTEAVRLSGASDPGAHLLDGQVELESGDDYAEIAVPTRAAAPRLLLVESFLGGGSSVPQGAVVGSLRVLSGATVLLEAPLRAGIETADAELEDPGASAPGHHLAPVAQSYRFARGARTFSIHVYRATLSLPADAHPDRIEIRRPAGRWRLYLRHVGFPPVPATVWPPVVESADPLPHRSTEAPAARLTVHDASPVEVEIRLAPPCAEPALLVLADGYDRGWRARVDGIDTPVMPAFLALRALSLPAGAERVVLRYEPLAYRHGLFLSVMALFALCAVRTGSR